MNEFSESSPNALIIFCAIFMIYLIAWALSSNFKRTFKNRKDKK